MNFLTKILNRLTGRDKEEEERKAQQAQASQAPMGPAYRAPEQVQAPSFSNMQTLPSPEIRRQPEIAAIPQASSFVMAPEPEPNRYAEAAESALKDTGNAVKSIFGAPLQGIVNPIRDNVVVPGYAALRSVFTGDENFNQSLETARQQVPKMTAGTRALEALGEDNPLIGNNVNKIKNFAEGGAALASAPLTLPTALTKVAALEKASAPLRLAGYSGIRAAQGALGTGLSSMSQEGATVEESLSPQNLALGAAGGVVLNTLFSPKLAATAMQEISSGNLGGARNVLSEIAPGIRTANPQKLQQIDMAVQDAAIPKQIQAESPVSQGFDEVLGNRTIEDLIAESGTVVPERSFDPVNLRSIQNESNIPHNVVRESEEKIATRLRDRNKDFSLNNTNDYRKRVLAGDLEDQRFPEEDIATFYRASDNGPIKAGDFVTDSEEVALKYRDQRPNSKVEKIEAPKSDFVKASGTQREMVYAPKKKDIEAPVEKVEPSFSLTGSAKTGETGISKGKFGKGEEYQKTSREAARKRGESIAANESFETFTKRVDESGNMTGADRDTASALRSRYEKNSPEYQRLSKMAGSYDTELGQGLSTIERTIRKEADADQISDRFFSKLYSSTDDVLKVSDDQVKSVIQKNDEFVKSREALKTAENTFNNDPSKENTEKVIQAFINSNNADKASKFEEYKVANQFAKGSSSQKTKDFAKKLEQDAKVHSMDAVDSSLLSSTRVMLNNYINTLTVKQEEMIFGKAGAAIARKLTGTDIGGGSRSGAKLGARIGGSELLADVKLRQKADGNGLMKTVKNVVTTGNTLGERNTQATAYSGIYDHYRSKLQKLGFSGEELDRRAIVNSLIDPDPVAQDYMHATMVNNALSSTSKVGGNAKFENIITDTLSRKLGDSPVAKTASKAITRVLIGYPTVIARSAVQGAKRTTLGVPSVVQAVANAVAKGPKEKTALHIKNAVKEAGSGSTMIALGGALGAKGLISGSYPTDKDEQARWKREGISENSIKIGKDWYNLPSALGVFALPFMIGANAGQNVSEGKPVSEDVVASTTKTLIDSLPTDSISRFVDFISDAEGGRDTSKYLASTGASLVRSVTPLGSLVNQMAKMFDPTANDTTKGDVLAQFVSKVQDGIPGAANSLPSRMAGDSEIKNPGAIARLFGAVSTEQGEGVEKTAEIEKRITDTSDSLKEYGAYNDNIRNILDDDTKAVFDKAKSGKKIDESDMKKLVDGMVKGVTESSDTRFLEEGDYDSNLAVLKAKKDLLSADPTTRKETIEAYDKQIKRGEVYKERNIPYDTIKKYKDIDLTEWRALGDPESEDYDADLYQKLWDIDSALTEAGVSRKSSDSTKPKYSATKAKKSGSGSGGNRRVTGNTIGSLPSLGKLDLGDLKPVQTKTQPLQKVMTLKPSETIKKRKISVSK